MTKEELTDLIYDTLMKNTGMSEHHKELPLEDVTVSSVAASQGRISLHFRFGEDFEIIVSQINDCMTPELEEELAAIAYDSYAHGGNPDSGHHN